ncbi:MAG: hypothetical protein OEU46_16605 [Alphaproteobacteria bacterium]|nr:hypothetical protein [Alphaproteobacteria bacterium]
MHRSSRFGTVLLASVLSLATLGVQLHGSRATDLDAAALDVFKRNKCNDCHVPIPQRVKDPKTGKPLYPAKRDFSFILDLEKVKASKYIVAGVPEKSSLYKMIIEEKMPEGAEFCFGDPCPYPPLSESDMTIIRDWIGALK